MNKVNRNLEPCSSRCYKQSISQFELLHEFQILCFRQSSLISIVVVIYEQTLLVDVFATLTQHPKDSCLEAGPKPVGWLDQAIFAQAYPAYQ